MKARNLLCLLNFLSVLIADVQSYQFSCEATNVHLYPKQHYRSGVIKLFKSDISSFLNEKPELFYCTSTHILGPSLANVTFSDTISSVLPSRLFEEFKNLLHLYIVDAGIQTIESPSQRNFSINLQTLHLSKNQISTIDDAFLTSCASLRDLDVSDNQLKHMIISSSLKLAKADNNQIGRISVQAGSRLESLSLSGNKLDSSVTIELNKIETLTDLDLSRNSISYLDFESFINLAMLEKLNLSRNQLSSFGFGVLSRQTSMTQLDLSHNQISHIKLESLAALSSLESLDISHNQISFFGMTVRVYNGVLLKPRFYMKSLASIHLDGNDWDCYNLIMLKLDLDTQNIRLEPSREPVKDQFNFLGIKCSPAGLA